MKLIAGRSNPELAEEIAEFLDKKLTSVTLKDFANGETYFKIEENVRGEDVFIIQSTITDKHIIELLLMIDAAKRASAQRVTAVIPWYGYARQDRKASPREPISAKVIANLISTAGADRVLAIDLHSPQIQGFFDVPLDDTWAFALFADYFVKKGVKDPVIVSPDAGGVKRASRLSNFLEAPIAIIDKRRTEHNKAEAMNVIGDVEGKNAIIFDDLIDTGGTISAAANAVKEAGAKEVYLCATHAVFSNDAVNKLKSSKAKEIIVTNTIPVEEDEKIKVLDITHVIGMAIKNIHEKRSVSTLDEQILEKRGINNGR